MPSLDTLALFAASTLALLLVPGPSVLFVVARTLEHGRTAGLVSVLGVETGAWVTLLASVVAVVRRSVGERTMRAADAIAGIGLVGFGGVWRSAA